MERRLKNVLVYPLKEEVRRRHRIKDVRFYNHDGRAGFTLITKSGQASIPAILRILQGYMPHIYMDIVEQNGWSEEELRELLIGKYIYGQVKIYEYEGTFTRIIQ